MSFTLMSKALKTKGLTSAEKLVLIALCDFADDKKNQCYPSHASIAEICSLSRMSTIRSMESLIKKGFISKENRKQKGGYSSNLYTILSDNFDAFQIPLLPNGSNTVLQGVVTQCYKGSNTVLQGVVTQCYKGSNTVLQNPIIDPISLNQSLNNSFIEAKTKKPRPPKTDISLNEFYEKNDRHEFRDFAKNYMFEKKYDYANAKLEFESFENYHKANGKKFKDWHAVFRKWVTSQYSRLSRNIHTTTEKDKNHAQPNESKFDKNVRKTFEHVEQWLDKNGIIDPS